MSGRPGAPSGSRLGVIVHGHRDGNAVGGRPWISLECMARLRAAERAVERYGAQDVLFCGAGVAGFPSEARQMARAWRGPCARLWLDEQSADTAENALQALRWMGMIQAVRLLVVSSWWHFRLVAYYRPFRSHGVSVRHVSTRRCDRVLRHLAHELRYAPRARSARHRLDGESLAASPRPFPSRA